MLTTILVAVISAIIGATLTRWWVRYDTETIFRRELHAHDRWLVDSLKIPRELQPYDWRSEIY